MKSISIKEPTNWQLADKIELLTDQIHDLQEASQIHSNTFNDFGKALLAVDRLFGKMEKKLEEIDKKCSKR